jgi:hypothetical protein
MAPNTIPCNLNLLLGKISWLGLIMTQQVVSTDPSSDPVLAAGKKLADILRSKKAYTNTATFDLKCEVREKRQVG